MSQAPLMLSAEQFDQLATKDYLDKSLEPIKSDIKTLKFDVGSLKIDVSKLKFSQAEMKTSLDALSNKLDLRFNQLDYKIERTFDHLENEYHETNVNHELRLKKLESF